jgi:hypothetical protein
MAAEGRCSSLPLMLVTMKRVPQVAGVRLRFASAVPCQCAIAVFILRDRDGAFSLSRDPAARALGMTSAMRNASEPLLQLGKHTSSFRGDSSVPDDRRTHSPTG